MNFSQIHVVMKIIKPSNQIKSFKDFKINLKVQDCISLQCSACYFTDQNCLEQFQFKKPCLFGIFSVYVCNLLSFSQQTFSTETLIIRVNRFNQ